MSSQRRISLSWRVSYTTSSIFEASDDETGYDCDYSVSEVSESFTLRQPALKRVEEVKADNSTNDDTDIELDDEFNEESLVTFQSPARRQTRMRKVTVVEAPGHHHHHNHSKCSTGCAQTYQASRDKRRRAVSTIVNPMLHLTSKQTCSTSEDTSATESSDEVTKLVPVRKKSRFTIKKEETKLVEGKWKLIGNRNYEEYLTELGTGACTGDMVMRADVVMSITQEEDKQWRIAQETLIKAKSVRGYRTNNRKWTENKFKANEAKPELLDDWDQRLVVTTLVSNENTRLTLNQVAEKDQWHCKDSTVIFEVDSEDRDTLIMTCMTENVIAWRKFQRVVTGSGASKPSRKISAPF